MRPHLPRRAVLRSAAALTGAATLAATTGTSAFAATGAPAPGRPRDSRRRPDVVLVHGAWADGTSWRRVIELLAADGHRTYAVPLPMDSLAGDAQVVREFVAGQGVQGPAVLAGHSYGGAVVSVASKGLAQIGALAYTAAFAPDEGESLVDIIGAYPEPAGLAFVRPDPQGRVYLDRDQIQAAFAPDVDRTTATVLAATQRPIRGAVFEEEATAPGWRDLPSWYLVSSQDQQISPVAQRALAARMNAVTTEVRASHVALISQPRAVADVIRAAARSLTPR